jgi:hypothetical protein
VSLKELALANKLRAFAKGKRFQVVCALCGTTEVAVDVQDLGRMLLAHVHEGDIGVTVSTGSRMGP